MLKHAAFISLEGNNIPLAKFLGQAHVYFGMDQKLGGKKELSIKFHDLLRFEKSFLKSYLGESERIKKHQPISVTQEE